MSLKSIEVIHSPGRREVLMVSGVSILNVCTFKNWFRLLRSSIGLHLLLGFGTMKSLLKKPRDV